MNKPTSESGAVTTIVMVVVAMGILLLLAVVACGLFGFVFTSRMAMTTSNVATYATSSTTFSAVPEPQTDPTLQAALELQQLQAALTQYRLDTDETPSEEQGLVALVRQPDDMPNWAGPYLQELPSDPWGRAYLYEPFKDDTYSLRSMGPDGTELTPDDVQLNAR